MVILKQQQSVHIFTNRIWSYISRTPPRFNPPGLLSPPLAPKDDGAAGPQAGYSLWINRLFLNIDGGFVYTFLARQYADVMSY
ncbi:hypothetical protein [Aeromonas hydrophila]|uniref:hypothetical protein n=1 Tax=Aeromonas hydrophila TaxID=644 RepID=UPI002B48EA85|nr:hypothetical protein [Aeromonas hydrophila]